MHVSISPDSRWPQCLAHGKTNAYGETYLKHDPIVFGRHQEIERLAAVEPPQKLNRKGTRF